MQPTHPPGSAGLPLEPYLSYIGEERWPYAFAWRTLTDAGALEGALVTLSFPATQVSPRLAPHDAAAVTV